jgi:VWFA-related protein
MRLRRSILFFILCSSLAASPQAQTAPANNPSPAATFKTKVRLVVVDVVVTNGKGDPIPDLKKSNFEVLEDGKPQAVSNFQEHKGVPPTQIKMPPMPPGVYTNFPLTQTADSVNILLLDALNTPSTDQSYVHAEMLKYLKTIPAGTRVGVFTLASRLQMLQGVTSDSSELLAAINNDKAATRQSPLLPSTVEKDSDQSRIDFLTNEAMGPVTPPDQVMGATDPISAAKQFLADTALFQTEARIAITLQALQQLARYLKDVPGRKNVIWFSGSFPAGIVPDSDLPDPFSAGRNFQEDIRNTTDLLTAAQVAIYPIAAEGLAMDTAFQVNGREIVQKRASVAAQDSIQQSRKDRMNQDTGHAAMEQLAKDTGGQAFYNTNGLNDAFRRVINNGTRYYTLAYAPTNANMDGKYRHIQVKLLNAKDTLAYRRGYYADDLYTALTAGQKPDSDPLMQLMGRNLPNYSQILYKILVKPASPQPAADAPRAGTNQDLKGPITRYGVDFAIAVDDLKLDPAPDGVHNGKIEVMLIAYDHEGKPLNLVVTKGDLRVQPMDYVSAQKGGLQIHKEIDVPRGDVYLRTGVYDLKSSSAGTLGVPLNTVAIPAAK